MSKIHAVWFGLKEPSQLALQCISTWPDDDRVTIWSRGMLSSVVPWLHDIPYFSDAYKAEHWAAASDVARLALLYELGGIYMDTDVEVVRQNFLDELAAGQDLVLGFEDDTFICGAVMVAPKPGHPFLKRALDLYRATKFTDTFHDTLFNGTTMLTQLVRSHQDTGLAVMPQHVFYPWTPQERHISAQDKAERKAQPGVVCAHHWEASWVK